ncbi:MAG TPA: VCBS repeat-containing protein [Pyrinomonadaceae bacterium]|jgi:hypothetical protein|nr:VCBS repeat-containing protein [Pyrinomonadaceae bacterium]
MKHAVSFIRRNSPRLLALGCALALYLLAQQPQLSSAERVKLADGFRFKRLALHEVPGLALRTHREVHPSLRRLVSWVSATGAAVALNDLDGDGLSNDVCLVDPRTDRVTIAPAPGEAPRYEPFVLDAGPLYDPSRMSPMGCLPGDLNEDGLTDVLAYYWGRTPIAFLARARPSAGPARLTGDSYRAQEVVPGGERWYTGAATMADLDGDGHVDLVLGNYYADGARILDADGAGTEELQHSMTRAFNGGRSRLLRWERATAGAEPSVAFRVVEDYVEGTRDERERVTNGWTLAVGAADLDGDLLPELYFANDFGPDRLLYNRSRPGEFRFAVLDGVKTLTSPNSKVVGRDSFKGMGVDFGDLNGDGLFDIYVSNIAAEYALEESHFAFVSTGETARMKKGVAPYVDQSEALGLSRSGWGWDTKLADLDNDGRPEALQAVGFMKGQTNRWPELHELAMGNDQLLSHPQSWPRFQPGDALSDQDHNPFFVRASDGRFYDVASELGLDRPAVSRGIALADVNGDGRLDYAVANQWDGSELYLNESPRPGSFLGLYLRLPLAGEAAGPTKVCGGRPSAAPPGRAAVGAVVTVRGPGGRLLLAQVDGGNGHSGKRGPEILFGLGQADAGVTLPAEVSWRDTQGRAHKQTFLLSPGWHTLTLGRQEGRSDECR